MATNAQAYQSIANVNLWFKLQSGDKLVLTDVPAIIQLRWTYLRDTWNQLLPNLLNKVNSYAFPDLFKQQLSDFTSFIDIQRNNTAIVNPLSDSNAIFRFYTVFDNITIQSINLTNQENTIIQDLTTAVKQYTKNDFI